APSLPLHDALPIFRRPRQRHLRQPARWDRRGTGRRRPGRRADRRARGPLGRRRGVLGRGRLHRGRRPGGGSMRARFILGEIVTGLWRNIAMVISVVIVTAVSLTFVGTGMLMQKQIMDMKSTLV